MLTPDPTYRIQQYSETPLEDLLNEMSNSRESFTAPEPKLVPYTDVSGAEAISDTPEVQTQNAELDAQAIALKEKEIKGKRQNTAKWLGKNTDRAMAFVTSLIADDDDMDEWKASPEDLQDIIECYFEMCEGYGWTGLPPWLNLVLCVGFTYGPNFREAMKFRGINKELSRKAAQAEADRAIAQAELIRIKLEQERSKIKPAQEIKTDPAATDAPAATADPKPTS